MEGDWNGLLQDAEEAQRALRRTPHAPHKAPAASLKSKRQQRALKEIAHGKPAKATQTLLSTPSAPYSNETADALEAL